MQFIDGHDGYNQEDYMADVFELTNLEMLQAIGDDVNLARMVELKERIRKVEGDE